MSAGSRRRHRRTILHIDLDCFYAQVEMAADPTLRHAPLGIQQKRIIVTCNYEARARGVRKLCSIRDALAACPELVIRKGENLDKYRRASERIFDILRRVAPRVERLGLDEFFIDATDLVAGSNTSGLGFTGHVWGGDDSTSGSTTKNTWCECGCKDRLRAGSRLAASLRALLRSELGFTSSAGISTSKMLAKMAGETHKPDDQTVLPPNLASDFLSGKNIRRVPGIGSATTRRLRNALGCDVVASVLTHSEAKVQAVLGDRVGARVYSLCRGLDPSPVIASGPAKSMSEEDSFPGCITLARARTEMHRLITPLLVRIDHRLKTTGDLPTTLHLSARYKRPAKPLSGPTQSNPYKRHTRQVVVGADLFRQADLGRTDKILDALEGLVLKISGGKTFHFTLFNVGVSKFVPAAPSYAARQPAIRDFLGCNESKAVVDVGSKRLRDPVSADSVGRLFNISAPMPGPARARPRALSKPPPIPNVNVSVTTPSVTLRAIDELFGVAKATTSK